MHNQLTQPAECYEPPVVQEIGDFADHTLGGQNRAGEGIWTYYN
ncbi:lasso RiPP family leader peptide-containing protein [Nonomuraea sp. MG754425]|nr:lasso RiPP family leader peptide-containing protein [Nonomuraea sp. MG754425]MCF6473379.1 lasso RiPP family leader peptide-containing protein [Nonomuraea sp. MG754425]